MLLHFPVSLLTVTALIEAITQVVCDHLYLMKLRSAGCLDCICECHTKHATSENTKVLLLEENPTDEESRMLHATSGLLEDVRAVMGLSAVCHPSTWLFHPL